MQHNTLTIRTNFDRPCVIEGCVPLTRLARIAAELVKPYRQDEMFHAALDKMQVRGAWEGPNDLVWNGYDYENQAWITIYLEEKENVVPTR